MSNFQIKQNEAERQIEVYTPYNSEFVFKLKHHVKDDYTNNSPKIVLFAKTIARAESRDYIGTISNGVTYISGGYVSGGSTKHPKVTIKGNSEIVIRNVPKQLFERELVPEQITVSIEEKKPIDVKALEEERKQLKKRIAEIDKLLKEVAESEK